MVRITEQLIRTRSEHNEGIISTLEELSLHQQDLEKIEYIDKWCRDLQILYLQSNIIPKIENVGRLKKLQYLNLALNNIERIENLEGCESLAKLDLTVNFVGVLTDVERLKANIFMKEIFLTGNPCTEYEGYREYVIATLPNLERLDGIEIEKSERILASQALTEVRPLILQQQSNYQKKRQREKDEIASGNQKKDGTDWYTNTESTQEIDTDINMDEVEVELTEEERTHKFWNEKTSYTPESRIDIHNERKKQHEKENPVKEELKKERRLIADDGRMLNMNEPKVSFKFDEDDGSIMVDVGIYKYMDSSLCDVDIQPMYIKVWIKGQLLQLTLPEEVKPDSSTAKRSQTTGHLLITMPKLCPIERPPPPAPTEQQPNQDKENKTAKSKEPEKLEIDSKCRKEVDIANIVTKKPLVAPHGHKISCKVEERANSDDFQDDLDVPPLM